MRSLLRGAGVVADRFPYGNAIMIETPLADLPAGQDLTAAFPWLGSPAPTPSAHSALTCPAWSGPTIAGEDLAPRIQEAWQDLLADKSVLPTGGVLGYPCCHLYHQDTRFQSKPRLLNRRSSTMLKGRDHLVAATAIQAGLKVRFSPS